MRKYKTNKSRRSNFEVLEDRRHLSAVVVSGGIMELTGDSTQNNAFFVRAASDSRVYGIADNVGTVAPAADVKSIVVHTGNDTDTVEVDAGIPLSVEVIAPDGQISWVAPGKTETFSPSANPSTTKTTTTTSSNKTSGSSQTTTPSTTTSTTTTKTATTSTGTTTASPPVTTTTTTTTTPVSTTPTTTPTSTTTTTDADAPHAVITVTSSSTVLPEETVNVQALASTFGDGTVLNSKISWNFGDPNSAYNSSLVGFNAAHVYASAGTYTITLTITTPDGHSDVATTSITVLPDTRPTIYVSTSGSDSNSGLSANAPIQTIAHLDQILTSNTRVLFESGDTFDTTVGININGYSHVYIGSYGTGAQPVIMYNGPQYYGALVAIQAGSSGITVQGLTFNSIYVNNNDSAPIYSAFKLAGSNIALLNNTMYNVMDDFDLSAAPSNVLIQNNASPSMTGLNAYFAWIDGNNIALVGNTVANSDGESTIRVGGANDLLIADNTVSDQPKGSIAIQAGTYTYVYNNTILHGPMGVGPLGVTGADPNAAFDYCVFDSNTVDAGLIVQPGADHVMIKNNVINNDGFGITINGQGGFNWQVQDVYVLNNTDIDTGPWGGFIVVNDGQPEGVHVDNNLFVDPLLQTGEGQGLIVDMNSNLDGFSQIQNNVWAIPTPSGWADGGYFYVNAEPGVQSGYLTPAEWAATGVSSGNTYENVTLGTTYSVVSADGVAGSDLPTA